jgi:DNA-directed RNA polymerase specialized sigma subunit
MNQDELHPQGFDAAQDVPRPHEVTQLLRAWSEGDHRQKRGGQSPHVELDENLLVSQEPRADVIALDDALTTLAAIDERKSQVVELRFFGGLGIDETAEVLNVPRNRQARLEAGEGMVASRTTELQASAAD